MKKQKKGDQYRENEILLKLSKTLISVSPSSRKKGLDIISRYISRNNESISRLQIIKLWKGLYYSMWLSDKVLIQREVALSISNLQTKFTSIDSWLSFIREFYLMMRFRWDNIDHYRMDKFSFLQRTMLSKSLELIKNKGFENSYNNGFFNVLFESLFVEDIEVNETDLNEIDHSGHFQNEDSVNCDKSNVNQFTGIGVSLIFCKQFPQEYVYLIYELHNSKKNDNSIFLFLKNYSKFVTRLLISNINHQTLNDYIKNQLIFSLFNSESLLANVLKDIEDLNIEEDEMNIVNDFIKSMIIEQMKIIKCEISELSKSRCTLINQVKRNRLYTVLEKVEEFLEDNKEELNVNLPKTSKNKMRNIKFKQEIEHNHQTKKVRFDMSKNTRMLLPDSISTSKALVRIFDKKCNSKSSNELNCILFRSTDNDDSLSNGNSSNFAPKELTNNFDKLNNIEIISAEKALSKPSNFNSSPLKGILKRSTNS